MKWSKRLLFASLLCLFVLQPLCSESYIISEEQYQALMNNWNEQEMKFNLLNNQFLTLSLQLQMSNQQLEIANQQLEQAQKHSQNSDDQLKILEESLKKSEDRKLGEFITVGSVCYVLGVLTSAIFFFIAGK